MLALQREKKVSSLFDEGTKVRKIFGKIYPIHLFVQVLFKRKPIYLCSRTKLQCRRVSLLFKLKNLSELRTLHNAPIPLHCYNFTSVVLSENKYVDAF